MEFVLNVRGKNPILIASPAKRAGCVVWIVQFVNKRSKNDLKKFKLVNNVGEFFETWKQLFY